MAKSSALRVREYRARQKAAGREDSTQRNHARHVKVWSARRSQTNTSRVRPFVGCDGEGAGVDELGRQNYQLFRMGARELFNGGERLTTEELLDFICDEPRGTILVGFAFGYDVTMILRDLPERQARRLFEPRQIGPGHSSWVYYKDFNIEYLSKQYFKVARVKISRDAEGKEVRKVISGSTRIIYETFGFFQKGFVKVISDFNIGTEEERASVAHSKAQRGGDAWTISDEERAYCALECRMLAELMEQLRENCHAAGIHPRSWNGAGKLAKALLASHDMPKGKVFDDIIPPEVVSLANMAYYGGRFEITRTGAIAQEVHEYDIISCYPDKMRHLPCLLHGRWKQAAGPELRDCDGLFVASVAFSAKRRGEGHGQLGAFPVRSKEGHLYWPLRGAGTYWSAEIRSAERRGFKVKFRSGWIYERTCKCEVFEWVEPLFEYRKSIGKSGPGYPIKLAINSLYGVKAQRKGNGQYSNMVWAGLITAMTRAQLNDAVALAPDDIVMIATDAVYSLKPLDLHCGDKLGDWEHETLNGLFIVQPGLYWCPAKRKRKSRGLSGRFFEEPGRTESFEDEWRTFEGAENSLGPTGDFPSVAVPVPGFIGLRLAISRGKQALAGKWTDETRNLSFDPRNKRAGYAWRDGHIVTGIIEGSEKEWSLPHRDFLKAGGAEAFDQLRLALDEQPDYVDLGIPWKD